MRNGNGEFRSRGSRNDGRIHHRRNGETRCPSLLLRLRRQLHIPFPLSSFVKIVKIVKIYYCALDLTENNEKKRFIMTLNLNEQVLVFRVTVAEWSTFASLSINVKLKSMSKG